MSKILFITNHRKDRSPGQRFRFEQYLDFLEQNGYEVHFSNLLNKKDDEIFYKKGNHIRKILIALKTFLIRLKDALRAHRFDIIFIFREAYFTGNTFFEKIFSKKAKTVFDFDDAIWVDMPVSQGNKIFQWFKNPSKTPEQLKLVDMVFAGNTFLKKYATQYNSNVKIIPTTIDTDEYTPITPTQKANRICIGWSGSKSTIEHFKYALPILREIKSRYQEQVEFKVIGNEEFYDEELEIEGEPWQKHNEIEELCKIDIGIMPLQDNEWERGKCGLKGLQYMALEIPTIMSPVGVNKEIIRNGTNGFLAGNKEEWIEALSTLIESPDLRKKIGKEGRKTVIDHYSFKSYKETFLMHLNNLIR